ncbi:hypothetical protein GCM10009551_014290 [Nocardiopsis tropica]
MEREALSCEDTGGSSFDDHWMTTPSTGCPEESYTVPVIAAIPVSPGLQPGSSLLTIVQGRAHEEARRAVATTHTPRMRIPAMHTTVFSETALPEGAEADWYR